MSQVIESLLDVAAAASAWERAHSDSKVGDITVRDQHRVTPRAELLEAERKLVAAVRAYRGASK
jgi:hypothetical protein